jgi:hypothetical protein
LSFSSESALVGLEAVERALFLLGGAWGWRLETRPKCVETKKGMGKLGRSEEDSRLDDKSFTGERQE